MHASFGSVAGTPAESPVQLYNHLVHIVATTASCTLCQAIVAQPCLLTVMFETCDTEMCHFAAKCISDALHYLLLC